MRHQSRGFALVLVIWALVLLAGMASGFTFAVREETRIAADEQAEARALASLVAARNQVVLALTALDPQQRWQADGQPHLLTWNGAQIKAVVSLETGRIDLNYAPRELLVGLFSQLASATDAEALAAAVIDWRDSDDDAQPEGAEVAEYRRAGYAYGPPNQPFRSVSELSRVMGFDFAMVNAATPYLTVYSRLARVNVISADLVTLTAIPGVDRSHAEAFIAARDSALASGDKPDHRMLRRDGRYIDTRNSNRIFTLDVEVRLPDDIVRAERLVVRLDRTRGFAILDRQPRSLDFTPGTAAQ